MLWVLKRTYVKIDGKENINNFTLKIFVYLNLWIFLSFVREMLIWPFVHDQTGKAAIFYTFYIYQGKLGLRLQEIKATLIGSISMQH